MARKPPSFEPVNVRTSAFTGAEPATRQSAAQRGYGSKWRMIRAAFLKAHPQCECGEKATEADHRVPVREGGSNAWSNLCAMCKRCHSRKTAARDGGFGNPKKSLGVRGQDRVRCQLPISTKLIF